MTFTVNDTYTGNSPLVIGVNLGHHYPGEGSWLAYLEHLGVNGASARAYRSKVARPSSKRAGPHGARCAALHGAPRRPARPTRAVPARRARLVLTHAVAHAGARNFGMGGLGVTNSGLGTLMATAASVSPDGKASTNWWGKDVLGNLVNDQAGFNAAVVTLRQQGGRPLGDETLYKAPASWVYPPAWATVARNMATIDVSVNSAEMTGTPDATVNLLAGLKIGVLAVEFLTWCARVAARKRAHRRAEPRLRLRSGNFVFTSMDPNQPAYWQERWELFKHQYVVAGWGWARAGAPHAARLSRAGAHMPRALLRSDQGGVLERGAPLAAAMPPCALQLTRPSLRSLTWAAWAASTPPPGWSTSRCAAWPSSMRITT